jgi:acyl-CoA thioester hydrolase
MLYHTTPIRVRYAETDTMGYVYYGNYATYFEVARSELVRALGVPYGEMEDNDGIMLPVIELHVNYKRPATYDQLIWIHTWLQQKPTVKIRFDHEVRDEHESLLATGHVSLAFTHRSNGKPARPPAHFIQALDNHWQ